MRCLLFATLVALEPNGGGDVNHRSGTGSRAVSRSIPSQTPEPVAPASRAPSRAASTASLILADALAAYAQRATAIEATSTEVAVPS